MFQIVSSVQGLPFQFYDNLNYLMNGLSNGQIHFQGNVLSYTPNTFVYDNKRRLYDFTRSAKADVRNRMASILCSWLPMLPNAQSREAFAYLFNYLHYKEYLKGLGNQRAESMYMLIFNKPHGYVALVQFNIVTRRNGLHLYAVNATLTGQLFSYFDLLESTLDEFLQKLQNLRIATIR